MTTLEYQQAWREGYNACNRAQHLTANPYVVNTYCWRYWRAGWKAADQDALPARD